MSTDYQLEDTLYLPFTTRAFGSGIPTVLVGGVIDIYEDATATPIVTGETLAVSLNSVVGFNMITVTATAGSGFNLGGHYTAVIQAGTVDSVSVVGEVVAEFTLDNSAAAKDLANGTDGLGAIKTVVDAIPTTAMRGTDGVDTATMRGTDSAATSAKQDTMETTLDATKVVVDAIPTTAMRGTDGVDTATMRGTDGVDTATMRGTDSAATGAKQDSMETTLNAIPTTAMRGTDNAAVAGDTMDVGSISGDSGAADALEASMETLELGTATGTPTTTTMADSALTETTNDHYNGRVIIWRTGALAKQATEITGYDGATRTFTFTAVTNACSASDAYVIV